uniref:Uncharacterized protein n=1 Tax=Oncorhynchus kisutch TaxID=8019 RepID=A0A8C7DV73_ONCKI
CGFNSPWGTSMNKYKNENHEEFLKAMAVPEMLVKMHKGLKPTTIIKQKGDDFTIKRKESQIMDGGGGVMHNLGMTLHDSA